MEKSKSKKWIWITVAVIVVLAVAALLLWHFLGNNENTGVTESEIVTEAAEDAEAPKAVAQDLTTYCGRELAPEDFLVTCEDESACTAKFQEVPDTSAEGEQEVTIIVADEAGNETVCTAKLTTVADQTAPEILGAEDKNLSVGDAFDPMDGVSVKDDLDPDAQISAVTNVDMDAPGEYTVRYKATDASGNKNFEVVKVTVS